MGLRRKAKNRVIILAIVAAVVVAGGGTVVGVLWNYRLKLNTAFKPEGMKAYADGENIKAENLLWTYLGRHSEDLEALDTYTTLRMKLIGGDPGELNETVNLYRRLISLKPSSDDYKRSLLKIYVQLNKNTEAVKLADEIMKVKPGSVAGTQPGERPASTDVETLQMKAAAQLGLRNYTDAEQTVNEAFKTDPLALNSAIQLMVIKQNSGELSKLPGIVQGMIKGHESDPRSPLLMAMAQGLAQNRKEAITAAKAATLTVPPTADYVWKLVGVLDQLEMFPEASEQLQKAQTQFKDDTFTEQYYQRLLYSEEYEKVASELAKPEMHAEKNTLLTAFRVIALCELKKKDEAKALLATLHEQGERWDYRAVDWQAVLEQVYFADPVKPRSIIDVSATAISREPWNPLLQLYLGNAYADVGDANEAMLRWNAATKLAPAWSRPFVQLAQIEYLQGDPDQALPLAQAADRRLPGQRDTQVALVLAWKGALELGHPGGGSAAELLAKIAEIQKKYPHEETTLPLQVALLVQMNNKSGAEARVREVVESTPPPGQQTLLSLSATCSRLSLGKGTELTELCLQKCEKLYGMTPALATARSRLLITTGKPDEARQLMDTARKAAKGDAESWGIAWCQLLEEIKTPDAAPAWKQLVAASPESTKVLWVVLDAYSVRQDHAFAGEVLDRLQKSVGEGGLTWRLEKAQWLLEDPKGHENQDAALKLLIDTVQNSPQSGRARELLAVAYENAGNLSQAEAQLTAASDLEPGSVRVQLSLARILLMQNKSVAAQQYLKLAALAQNATDQEKLDAGIMLAKTGEMDTSTRVIEQAAATDTTDRARWYLAGLYWRRGEMDKAEAAYTELLKKPTVEIISTASGFFLARNKPEKADEALALLGKLKLAPGEQNRILGISYGQRGDVEKAVKYLTNSVEEAPDSVETWRRLIATQISAKRPADAIAAAEKAKKALPDDEICTALRGSPATVTRLLEDDDTRGYFMTCVMQPEKNKGAGEVVAALTNVQLNQAGSFVSAISRLANVYRESMALQVLTIRKEMQAGQIDDALNLANRARNIDTASPLPSLYASVCYAMEGKWVESLGAAQQWRNAIPSDPVNPDMVIAASMIGMNREDDAIRLLHDYQGRASLNPGQLRALVSLVAAAKLQENAPGSVDEAAAGMWPYVKDIQWREQWRLLAMEKVPDISHAKDWLVRLRGVTPDTALEEQTNIGIAWHTLGWRLNDNFSKQEGLRILTALSSSKEMKPNLASQIALVTGVLCETDGDVEQAEANYRRALSLDAQQLPAANNLAMILARKGTKLDEATVLAQRAADGKPEISSYWDTLGFVLSKNLQIDQAKAAYEKAIAADTANPIWRIDLADMLLSAGKRDLAREAFRDAEGRKPDPEKLPDEVRTRYEKLKVTFGMGAP